MSERLKRWMRIKHFIVLIISVVFMGATVVAVCAENNPTLCASGEDVYFSCPLLGGKMVSVCASGNNDPRFGYVQYRYGLMDNIELIYPIKKSPPLGRFFLVDASEGSVNLGLIKFKVGSYTYIVAQAFVSFLTVLKDGEVIFRKSCDAGGHAFINRAALKGIETVPKNGEDFR